MHRHRAANCYFARSPRGTRILHIPAEMVNSIEEFGNVFRCLRLPKKAVNPEDQHAIRSSTCLAVELLAEISYSFERNINIRKLILLEAFH